MSILLKTKKMCILKFLLLIEIWKFGAKHDNESCTQKQFTQYCLQNDDINKTGNFL